MSLLRFLFVGAALVAANETLAQVPYWYIWAPPGTHEGGPGAGIPGKLVTSPVETGMAGGLSALWSNVTNLSDILNSDTGSDGANTKQQKIIEEAIGKRVAGDDIALVQPEIDPITLIRRQQMLEELRSSRDAEAFRHFILYFEAVQAHEARQRVYVERLNTLIKVNKTPLNWQERVRLCAQVGLLAAQHSVAEQEMIEIRNRAVVQASLDRLALAAREAKRLRDKKAAQAMLGGVEP